MKKITLILLTFLTVQLSYSQCEFTISLSDTYGDGWIAAYDDNNEAVNHTIDVLVGGAVVLNDITITDGNDASYTFEVSTGDPIEVVFTDVGDWSGECGYTIYNNVGEVQVALLGAGDDIDAAGPADTSAFESVCSDACPPPLVTSWSMTSDGASLDGYNQEGVVGYQIEYSTQPFVGGDGSASLYEFESFPHEMSGVLEAGTTYYMTIRSICGEDDYSAWSDNGNNGPDQWITSNCQSSYSLPYFNDFGEVDLETGQPNDLAVSSWSNCNSFYNLDSDSPSPDVYNYWFLQYITVENEASAVSYSAASLNLDPDNWFILGPIDLTDEPNAMLTWDMLNGELADYYSVYVGTENNAANFIESSLVSYSETTTAADGVAFTARELDISAAVGNEVYIAFRHHNSAGQLAIAIDNVSVTSTLSSEEFSIENLNYSYNIDSKLLTIDSSEMLKKINIYNLLGQEVISSDVNGYNVNMNLSELNSSVYVVTVEGVNNTSDSFKIIVK